MVNKNLTQTMKSIEEITRINGKLSFINMIYSKYKWEWLFIGFTPFITAFTLLLLVVLNKYESEWIWAIIPAIGLMIFTTVYNLKKTGSVVRDEYPDTIEKDEKWNYKTIIKIRKQVFIRELDEDSLLTPDNLRFLIDCLQRENETQKYNYKLFSNSVIIIISVFLGAFIGGMGEWTDGFNQYIELFKQIGGIILLFLLLIWYLEFALIRQFVKSNKNKKNRLIRTIENILIELKDTVTKSE